MFRKMVWGLLVAVGACLPAAGQYHDVDTSQDGRVGLGELLRVVQFYNAETLHCDALTEDGFDLGPGEQTCSPHDSDYAPQDWSIQLAELLRSIQFYNLGGYYTCGDSEDGFCAGDSEPGEGEGSIAPEAAFFVLNATGQTPLAVQFLDMSVQGSQPIASWTWDFGDGTDSTDQHPQKTYTEPGVYSVSLQVTNPLGSDTYVQTNLIAVSALSPALLLSSDPKDGEYDVAVTREMVLEFGAPLNPAVLSNNAVTVLRGTQPLTMFRNLSPDGRRLTLFPSAPLPGNTLIRVALDGAQLLTTDGRAVDVDGDGSAGGERTLTYTTLGLGALPGTAVYGRVFASEFGVGEKGAALNTPLEGVEIFVDGRFNLTTTTDVNGNFRLEPVPAGKFFVHINGLAVATGYVNGVATPTSFPNGPYYPFVGKAWEAVAGRDTSVGDIYLPQIPEGALTPVQSSTVTEIRFPDSVLELIPEYASVRLLVPPNALYNDFGTRGGSVGISAVAPDRLPSPLPQGLALPLVITVQSSGPNNFDQPVPACFPNAPDPEAGESLPAGSSSALWSFDHDRGDWAIVGSMTVSEDGLTVCTDPGVGILEPGWHGTRPGTQPAPLPSPPINFPPFEHPHFCDISEQECINSILFSSLDLLASVIPFGGAGQCAATLGYGAITAWRDCSSLSPGADCLANVVGTAGGAANECGPALLRNAPIIGVAATALDLVVSTLDSCTCIDKGTSVGVSAQAQAYGDYFRALSALFQIQYGSAKWTELGIDSPNFRRVATRIAQILAALESACNAASPGGTEIIEAEQTAIASLDLPDGFVLSDVESLLAHRNNTFAQWNLGLFTHVAAGRTDFIDQTALLAALDDVLAAMNVINASPETVFNPREMLLEINAAVVAQYAAPGAAPAPFGETDFVLTDLDTGTQTRGRIQGSGFLPIAALAPQRDYSLAMYHLPTQSYTSFIFRSAPNGELTEFPAYLVRSIALEADGDGDGLPDVAETVYNTSASEEDTDGDGMGDLEELEQGNDPLDGLPPGVGLLANVDTPGTAHDVAASNDLVAVADGSESGVSVFNIYNGMPPAIVAQLDTDGQAYAVAAKGTRIAVADGLAGLALLDVTNPVEARRVAQVDVDADLVALAIDGNEIYAVSLSSELLAIDLDTGAVLERLPVGGVPGAVSAANGTVSVLGAFLLSLFSVDEGMTTPRGVFDHGPRFRPTDVFNAAPIVYYSHFYGYDTVDISDLDNPVQAGRQESESIGTFEDIAVDGSGLALAVYTRSSAVAPVGVLDASNPTETEVYLDEYETLGTATRLALHAGLAYVADGDGGLSVLAYREPDQTGVAPVATYSIPEAGGETMERNRRYRILVNATDNVQVRSVELLLDGDIVEVDSSFPHEFQLFAPGALTQPDIDIAVRAIDTGGNQGTSATTTYTLTPDTTPPTLRNSNPKDGRLSIAVEDMELRFSEPLEIAALSVGVSLMELGTDGVPGGGDDIPVTLAAPSLDLGGTLLRLSLSPAGLLPDGLYQLLIAKEAIADGSGNTPASDIDITFAALTASDGTLQFNNLTGGAWDDPDNWLGGVPEFNDRVSINIPRRDISVTIDSGTYIVAGIDTSESIVIASGSELALRGDSSLRGPVSIGGGLSADGASVTVSVEGSATVQANARIESYNGAELVLETVTSLSNVTLRVNSATLDMPLLTQLIDSNVYVTGASAVLDTPLLSSLPDCYFDVSDATLSLPQVLSISGATLDVSATGTFTLAALLESTDTTLRVDGPGAALQVPSLVTMTNPTVTSYSGASISLPALTSIEVAQSGPGLSLFAGGTLSAPLLTAVGMDGTVNGSASLTLYASGAGTLDLSALTTLTRVGSTSFGISAYDGATVDLASLATVEESVSVSVYTGGQIMLDALLEATLSGYVSGEGSALAAPLLESLSGTMTLQDGTLVLPALTDLLASLTLQGDSSFNAGLLETFANGTLSVYDSTAIFQAPLLDTLEDASVYVYDGATLTLGAVTQYTVTDNSRSIQLQGEGSTLTLPALEEITLDGGSASLNVVVSNGGQLGLALLSSIVTPTDSTTASFTATGANSLINLSSLASFNPLRVTLTASSGGTIDFP